MFRRAEYPDLRPCVRRCRQGHARLAFKGIKAGMPESPGSTHAAGFAQEAALVVQMRHLAAWLAGLTGRLRTYGVRRRRGYEIQPHATA
jgi:hypothetical protein